ncbi:MAG: AmmeMemoRadiSam system protein B [Mariprofundales bacterium]|nr:AmmeMemoRadiSam system protein B [Mariprofundales bacterium]
MQRSKESAAARPAAVAGLFYSADPAALRALLLPILAPMSAPNPDQSERPRALIVPHAGHSYCATVAAHAFRLLHGHHYARVAIICPTHRVAVAGAAIPTVTTFATPLGEVMLDAAGLEQLATHPAIVANDAAHREEHAIEVLLPYLQLVLDHFTLIPIAASLVAPEQLADAVRPLWQDNDTLIIISSDLSHFHPDQEATTMDAATCADICHAHPIDHAQACGATGINTLQILRQQEASTTPTTIRLLSYCNSGDTGGDRHSVVGYASFVLT